MTRFPPAAPAKTKHYQKDPDGNTVRVEKMVPITVPLRKATEKFFPPTGLRGSRCAVMPGAVASSVAGAKPPQGISIRFVPTPSPACVDRGVRLGKDQREEGADEVHARGAGPGRRVEPSEAADLRPHKARRDCRAGQVARGHGIGLGSSGSTSLR